MELVHIGRQDRCRIVAGRSFRILCGEYVDPPVYTDFFLGTA